MNMPNDVDNTKITLSLGKCGYLPQDVRTMTKFDKNTKQIRTFAFVEFSNLETAEQWMRDYEGWLTLDDGRTLAVEYAKGDPASGSGNKGDDWICAHCSMNNFVKRQTCFKCEISKEQSMELEKLGAHMVGMTPCDTLLIRGLPDGISNSLIFDSLQALVCLSSISMIKLSESKRFAYLQMKSADEAKMLLNLTYKTPIRIKEKDVQVSWCRDSMSKLIQQQMTMLTAGPGKNVVAGGVAGNMTGAEIAAAALSKAHAVRQASHQVGQIMTGLPAPAAVMIPPNFNVPPPNMSVPPPMQPIQPEHQMGVVGMTQTPKGLLPKYLPPNPLSFTHDPNAGYYVDPITNFFYDSATGYYFNNVTSQWCTWDLTFQTYFPVETPAESVAEQADKKKSVEEGPKGPQDLAKDMAKWAKKQEKDKKKVQISLKGKDSKGIELKNVFSQEKRKMAQSVLGNDDDEEEEERQEIQSRVSEEPSTSSTNSTPLAPRKPTLQDVRDAMERALYDEAKKTCMLCKRAFSDVEVLRKHVEKSELHRKNLEAKRAEWGRETAIKLQEEEDAPAPELPKIVYRDRAKERRRQFGVDSTGYAFDVMGGQSSSGRNEDAIRRESEDASKRPLDDTNIGNRLLKSMGWKEGQGVGKHGQGIVNPIQAERFVQGAGLGAAGSKMRHGVEATHKEKTRQALYSRYHDS
uniref:RanBP2-type domain-containing protein n=2 Tax=Caenorhabditis tropicalis TaxID=1561998 RepID=A0A1I7UXR7_9PELO